RDRTSVASTGVETMRSSPNEGTMSATLSTAISRELVRNYNLLIQRMYTRNGLRQGLPRYFGVVFSLPFRKQTRHGLPASFPVRSMRKIKSYDTFRGLRINTQHESAPCS